MVCLLANGVYMYCRVSAEIDRYMDRCGEEAMLDIAEERFNERVSARAKELMAEEECSPFNPDNLWEATWDSLDEKVLKELAHLMKQGLFEQAGKLIAQTSKEYWQAKAEERARVLLQAEDEQWIDDHYDERD